MTPREEEDQKRLHFQNPPLWMVCLLAYIQVRLFWGKGAGTIWQVDKLDTDTVIMANIKQDELWVDLLFDGTASTALAESKRFRLGHIRNGKISYQLYPKRKDFVSLNVAIKNLAAVQAVRKDCALFTVLSLATSVQTDEISFRTNSSPNSFSRIGHNSTQNIFTRGLSQS